MDILSVQPNVRTLVVKHPSTGKPIGLEIDFRSFDSEEVQMVERQLRQRALRAGRSNTSVDKLDENEYTLLHAVTAAWRWGKGLKLGELENPPLNRVNTEKLYRLAPWVKKQLDDEMRDEASFFTTAPESSSDT